MVKTVHVGLVIPLEAEAKPIIKRLTYKETVKIGTRTILTGRIGRKKLAIIISGCGKIKSASATQFLIDNYPASYYIHYTFPDTGQGFGRRS
jgi:nucleoside phosphorylase